MTPTPTIRRMLSTALEVFVQPADQSETFRCLCLLKVPSVGLELGTHFAVSRASFPDPSPATWDNALVSLSQAHLREAIIAALPGALGETPRLEQSPLSLSSPGASLAPQAAPSGDAQLQRDYDELKAKYDRLFLRTVGLHDAGRG